MKLPFKQININGIRCQWIQAMWEIQLVIMCMRTTLYSAQSVMASCRGNRVLASRGNRVPASFRGNRVLASFRGNRVPFVAGPPISLTQLHDGLLPDFLPVTTENRALSVIKDDCYQADNKKIMNTEYD